MGAKQDEYKQFGVFALAGDLTPEQLQEEIRQVLREQGAQEEGVEVRPAGAGFAGSEVVIACLPLVIKIVGDLWDTVVLPRIEQRWGRGALSRSNKA